MHPSQIRRTTPLPRGVVALDGAHHDSRRRAAGTNDANTLTIGTEPIIGREDVPIVVPEPRFSTAAT